MCNYLVFVEVFDEWGAVIRHFDEVNKEADYQEKLSKLEKREQYRQELERQKEEAATKVKMSKNLAMVSERESLKKDLDMNKEKAAKEEQKIKSIKEKAIKVMDDNIKIKMRIEEDKKKLEKQDSIMVEQILKKLKVEEEEKNMAEKLTKVTVANALKESYAIQQKLQTQEKQKEKEIENLYLIKAQEKLAAEEKDRQRVWNKL